MVFVAGTCASLLHSTLGTLVEVHLQERELVIGLGSNVGNRIQNFNDSLQLMKNSGICITQHGCLYETAPVYVTDQPLFLNSAVRGITKLGPHELQGVLKKIEKDIGRTAGIRYGPRPIDLDIVFYGKFRVNSEIITNPHQRVWERPFVMAPLLDVVGSAIDLDIVFYGKFRVNSEILTIPHQRVWERPFVMAPLLDVVGSSIESDTIASWHSFSDYAGGLFESWEKLGGESLIGKDGLKRGLSFGNSLWDWSQKTSMMGILNLTVDSFTAGGKFQSVEAEVSHVRLMILEGADIIDIGAQSTRPMAFRLSAKQELNRLIMLELSRKLKNNIQHLK